MTFPPRTPHRASWQSLAVVLGLPVMMSCEGLGGIKVLENPPGVSFVEPQDGAVFEDGETITFVGRVDSSFTGGELLISWYSDIDGEFEDPDPPDPEGYVEFVTASLSPGTHVMTLRAIDANAEQGEDYITIEILGDVSVPDPEAPSLTITHPVDDEKGLDNADFVFGARVSDYQDDPTDIYVEVSELNNGFICELEVDSGGNAQCAAAFPVGDYQLTFTAVDSDGNEVNKTTPYSVVDPNDYDFDGDGISINGGDCNDDNANIYPGAPEICDGLDNDCNEATGIDVGSECYDDDGDGYCEVPPCLNASSSIPDCDDTNASVSPVGVEVPNYLDDDCNTLVDDTTVRWDDDSDGYCEAPPCENVGTTQSDCDDTNPLVNPAATEICDDGIDNDCDALLNEQNASGCSLYYNDSDGDGYGYGASQCWCSGGSYPYTATNNTDCYDTNAAVNPGQTNYFSYQRGDGSYDYNCNGAQEQQYASVANSCAWDIVYLDCDLSGSAGFSGSIPSCGSTAQWINDCSATYNPVCYAWCLTSSDPIGCLISSCGATCDADYTSLTQACR